MIILCKEMFYNLYTYKFGTSTIPTFNLKNILSDINFFFSTFFKTIQLYWYYNALVLFNKNIYSELISYFYQQISYIKN